MLLRDGIPAVEEILLKEDVFYPNNNKLPALLYKGILNIPMLFPARSIITLFKQNNWSNVWTGGILTCNHYHSITHEVLGFYKGKTTLLLGGDKGMEIVVEKGDVLIIPVGVAHKNVEDENSITCVGAYPDGMDYDMNYGIQGERPGTDKNIRATQLPKSDPLYGVKGVLQQFWK